jgi:hypothetical protein
MQLVVVAITGSIFRMGRSSPKNATSPVFPCRQISLVAGFTSVRLATYSSMQAARVALSRFGTSPAAASLPIVVSSRSATHRAISSSMLPEIAAVTRLSTLTLSASADRWKT